MSNPRGGGETGPRFALVQISGVHAALAVAGVRRKDSPLPDPLLLQVNEALLHAPDGEDLIHGSKRVGARRLRRQLSQLNPTGRWTSSSFRSSFERQIR
jgi:hypothetical protein